MVELTSRSRNLIEAFAALRARADETLDELDATAQALASSLVADGLTMRQAAPLMSRKDSPICHAQVAHARKGGRSRRPWAGHKRKGGNHG